MCETSRPPRHILAVHTIVIVRYLCARGRGQSSRQSAAETQTITNRITAQAHRSPLTGLGSAVTAHRHQHRALHCSAEQRVCDTVSVTVWCSAVDCLSPERRGRAQISFPFLFVHQGSGLHTQAAAPAIILDRMICCTQYDVMPMGLLYSVHVRMVVSQRKMVTDRGDHHHAGIARTVNAAPHAVCAHRA
jgi:hypothetical protein